MPAVHSCINHRSVAR